MSQKRGGLGRNLSALLSQASVQITPDMPLKEQAQIEYKPINQLQAGEYQPRRTFSAASISELAESIRQQGLLQPLVVRELQSNHYEIIAGERRWRACQQAGLTQVPVIIKAVNDETALALALIENLQREDLTALDQARAMQRLLVDFGLSHQQIAELLSKSRATVTNHLRLLNLSTEVQTFLEQGSIDMGHARSLLTLSEKEQKRIAHKVVANALSVRETEKLVNAFKNTTVPTKKPPVAYPKDLQTHITHLAQNLNTQVRIKPGDADGGTLMIHYSDFSNLQKIIAQILGD